MNLLLGITIISALLVTTFCFCKYKSTDDVVKALDEFFEETETENENI